MSAEFHENDKKPTKIDLNKPNAIQKLREILSGAKGEGSIDLIWGPEIKEDNKE